MRWLVHMMGHGFGIAGVMIGIGSILRAIQATAPRFLPYAHILTSLRVGAPLSVGLVPLAILLVGFGKGA